MYHQGVVVKPAETTMDTSAYLATLREASIKRKTEYHERIRAEQEADKKRKTMNATQEALDAKKRAETTEEYNTASRARFAALDERLKRSQGATVRRVDAQTEADIDTILRNPDTPANRAKIDRIIRSAAIAACAKNQAYYDAHHPPAPPSPILASVLNEASDDGDSSDGPLIPDIPFFRSHTRI